MDVVFIQHSGCVFSQAVSHLVLCTHLCIYASKYRCTYTYLCLNGSSCWGLSVGEMADHRAPAMLSEMGVSGQLPKANL